MVTNDVSTTEGSELTRWRFLGVVVVELSVEGPGPVVSELHLPEGASPPEHVHDDLADSFYVIDGLIVTRCGGVGRVVRAGDWVPFPCRVPHTFRVVGGPARILAVHANRSFLDAVHAVGQPLEEATRGDAALPDELVARRLAAHGIVEVGPPMELGEAEALLSR